MRAYTSIVLRIFRYRLHAISPAAPIPVTVQYAAAMYIKVSWHLLPMRGFPASGYNNTRTQLPDHSIRTGHRRSERGKAEISQYTG